MENIEINNRVNMFKMLDRSGIAYVIDFSNYKSVTVYFTGVGVAYIYGSLEENWSSEKVVYFGNDWAMFGARVLEKVQQLKGAVKNESI